MYHSIYDLVLGFGLGMNVAVGIFLLTKELPTVNWHKKYQEVDTTKCAEPIVDQAKVEKRRWRKYDKANKVAMISHPTAINPTDMKFETSAASNLEPDTWMNSGSTKLS